MPHNDDVYLKVSEEGGDSQRVGNVRIFKLGATLIGGACLGACLAFLILSNTGSVTKATDLIGMPTSLRASAAYNKIGPAAAYNKLADLPAGIPGPRGQKWKELGLASLENANRCDRDISAQANPRLMAAVANMDPEDQVIIQAVTKRVSAMQTKILKKSPAKAAPGGGRGGLIMSLPGLVAPVKGLWDPFGLSVNLNDGELLFFREAEIKHGRVCMLAAAGIWVQENFHPLFGGDIDVPAINSIGVADIALFWPALFVALGALELPGLSRIDYGAESLGFQPSLAAGEEPGAIGFDPLGLSKDGDPEKLLDYQNKELLHGRLSMIGAAGMIAQELLTQSKLNEGGIFNEVINNPGYS